ncbi:MAG: hypothetical protein JOZ89_09820, partial [Gammaproteobacteria bacterium]|nr:hypothetical protein [Gammaproteobacteria bacterium]
MRRPSPPLVVATAALFIALSGVAYATTGGTFILGKSNTATSLSSLSNSKGTALSLTSKPGTPALNVSNGVQVPNLNASMLGGTPAAGFIHGYGSVNGTGLNSTTAGQETDLGPAGTFGELWGYCETAGILGAEVRLLVSSSALFSGQWGGSDQRPVAVETSIGAGQPLVLAGDSSKPGTSQTFYSLADDQISYLNRVAVITVTALDYN